MASPSFPMLAALLFAAATTMVPPTARSDEGTPPVEVPGARAIEVPSWFKMSFLDLSEDVAEAARAKRRVVVYFGQDGCSWCKKLMEDFAKPGIARTMHAHFDAIEVNIWGSKDVTWFDGKVRTEKEFARFLKIHYTPTLLFFDEKGNTALRLNGYPAPAKLAAALDYVSGKMERIMPFDDYVARHGNRTAKRAAGAVSTPGKR